MKTKQLFQYAYEHQTTRCGFPVFDAALNDFQAQPYAVLTATPINGTVYITTSRCHENDIPKFSKPQARELATNAAINLSVSNNQDNVGMSISVNGRTVTLNSESDRPIYDEHLLSMFPEFLERALSYYKSHNDFVVEYVDQKTAKEITELILNTPWYSDTVTVPISEYVETAALAKLGEKHNVCCTHS